MNKIVVRLMIYGSILNVVVTAQRNIEPIYLTVSKLKVEGIIGPEIPMEDIKQLAVRVESEEA